MAVGDSRFVFGFVRLVDQKRHFKVILCCFWSIISPHTKFRPNLMKNAVVENFHYWSVLVGRAGRSKNGHNHFIQIRQKTQNLKILAIGPFWLVGLV